MTPEEYGLIMLCRRWSEDAHCAGWMGDLVTDEERRTEFSLWLKERGMAITLESYEVDSLSTLRECWRAAQITEASVLRAAVD